MSYFYNLKDWKIFYLENIRFDNYNYTHAQRFHYITINARHRISIDIVFLVRLSYPRPWSTLTASSFP